MYVTDMSKYHNAGGYIEYGLAHIMFYVHKHMTPLGVCSGLPLVHNKLLGAPAFVRLAYCILETVGWDYLFMS